ncbi:MAG: helix-turn-helix domain-containing protein [Aeromicrobium sp.]|uniref:helix-turn-helix domain-containing protein n=1 Tax=Aeromicrobium sp. TaxID=1871063 RepID=UPI00261F92DE|nr:helix-turn-helix domain-containing protein [Aeromicrobium sp.]MDF1705049.1 helix-turn-helix domain-containing protein [Aeromicrobium sp.]
MSDEYARLGRLIRERRDRLGLTQADLASRGGPSTTTMSKVEYGKLIPIPRQTRAKIEASLDWAPGSVIAVIEGGEPTDGATTAGRAPDFGWAGAGEELVEGRGGQLDPAAVNNALQAAQEAQIRFERAVDELLVAEADFDRKQMAAFRIMALWDNYQDARDLRERELGRPLAAEERIMLLSSQELQPTPQAIAEIIVTNAVTVPHEWTRLEAALVERLEPDYPIPEGGIEAYERRLDMTHARREAGRYTISDYNRVTPEPAQPSSPEHVVAADSSAREQFDAGPGDGS